MTDQPPSPPIEVNGSPNVVGLQAALRVLLVAGGSIAATLGFTALAGDLNITLALLPQILAVGGALVTLGAGAFGVLRTWREGQKSVAMASQLPDAIAKTK